MANVTHSQKAYSSHLSGILELPELILTSNAALPALSRAPPTTANLLRFPCPSHHFSDREIPQTFAARQLFYFPLSLSLSPASVELGHRF